MEKVLDKKPGTLDWTLIEFITNATPRQLVGFVEGLEQQTKYDLSEIVFAGKVLAFTEMLRVLKASSHTYKCNNSKRYYTELHIDHKWNSISLFISKKDSQNLDAMYVRLYDQHTDELLRLIDAKTVKEVEYA